jgi:hypothetical protein
VRDAEVRAALHGLLATEHAHELAHTRIVNELDLCGMVRVDVAVLNGQFAGYELKSAQDTLKRLPTQVRVYSQVLDLATLVVAESHLSHAKLLIPAWWGIVVARAGASVSLERDRAATWNEGVDPSALVRLLWRDELVQELALIGIDRGMRASTRAALATRLVAALPVERLREIVRDRVKQRAGWRVAQSRRSDGATFRGVATPSVFRR